MIRLKTFFSGWVADEAIEEGQVDLIPSRFVKIPQLIDSLLRPVDVAIVQITQPSEAGFCSLGIAIDVAREALEQARIAAGQASKAKRDFLDNMSHEIRTPMNGMLGMAQLLQKTGLDETQTEYVDTLITSGNA